MSKRDATPDALTLAIRALEHRDHSTAELRDRLDRRGVAPDERDDVLARLARSGVVDDGRFAAARAAALAERGYGDAAIDADLAGRGIPGEVREIALARLEPEAARARVVIGRWGLGARTARRLASRGFGAEAIAAASGSVFASDP